MVDAEVIRNPRTGQSMRFLAAEPGEDVSRFESVNPPSAKPEPVHVHPLQESRMRVLEGELVLVVDGVERRIGPGEEIVIPAGAPHFFRNDGHADAIALNEFRPALATEAFFRTYFDLAQRGIVRDDGSLPLLTMAVLGPRFADEIRVALPPWPVQRAAFLLLGPLARRVART